MVYALKGQCGLMVSALVHKIERIRVETWPPHCIVLLDKTLNSHSASFHSGQGCSTSVGVKLDFRFERFRRKFSTIFTFLQSGDWMLL